MAKKLVEIEGIGSTYARQLEEAGVKSQEALLEAISAITQLARSGSTQSIGECLP